MADFDPKRFIFFIGLIVLAHGIYMAFTLRGQLQASHHSRGYIPAANFGGTTMTINAMRIPITLEVISGMVLAIVGFVQRTQLNCARLCDFTKNTRYDEQTNTGVGFIHFNHRGTLANKGDASQRPKTDEEKKKE